jgi:hypothetical protein
VLEVSSELSLSDKIGLACRFLSDSELIAYVERTTAAVVKEGSLEGIALTGLTPKVRNICFRKRKRVCVYR